MDNSSFSSFSLAFIFVCGVLSLSACYVGGLIWAYKRLTLTRLDLQPPSVTSSTGNEPTVHHVQPAQPWPRKEPKPREERKEKAEKLEKPKTEEADKGPQGPTCATCQAKLQTPKETRIIDRVSYLVYNCPNCGDVGIKIR